MKRHLKKTHKKRVFLVWEGGNDSQSIDIKRLCFCYATMTRCGKGWESEDRCGGRLKTIRKTHHGLVRTIPTESTCRVWNKYLL